MARTSQLRFLATTQQHIGIVRAGYLKMFLHVASLTILYLPMFTLVGKDQLMMEQFWKQRLMQASTFLLINIILQMQVTPLHHGVLLHTEE